MATSYNGWPASPDKAEIGVVASDVFPGGAKAGDVTIVLGYVARQLNARVEPCVDGWNWGYTYKANVNNPSQLSCHASGTAIDWNAPDHPNGSSGTFTDAQVGQIYAILDEVQGAVGWLQGYDEMHFEVQVGAADLAQVAALLGDATPPTVEDDLPYSEDDLTRIMTAAVQQVVTSDDYLSKVAAKVLDGFTFTDDQGAPVGHSAGAALARIEQATNPDGVHAIAAKVWDGYALDGPGGSRSAAATLNETLTAVNETLAAVQ
jgi:hypothetical protein